MRQVCDTPESVIRQVVAIGRVVRRISLGYCACRQLSQLVHIPEFVAGMRQQRALVAAPIMLLGISVFVIQGTAREYKLHEFLVVGRERGVGRPQSTFFVILARNQFLYISWLSQEKAISFLLVMEGINNSTFGGEVTE